MRNEDVGAVGLVTMFLFALLAGLLTNAHCTVTAQHNNSVGVVMDNNNPMTYKAGTVSVSGNVKASIVLRIQPIGAYSLFTEDILICGHPAILFSGKANPLVLTYRTKASRIVDGIGCHELVHVDSLRGPTE